MLVHIFVQYISVYAIFFLTGRRCTLLPYRKGSPGAAVKLLPCDHEVMGVLETTSCRNAGKSCVHKTESGRTFSRTLRKREQHAPGCPF
jgi:hypothetical protein